MAKEPDGDLPGLVRNGGGEGAGIRVGGLAGRQGLEPRFAVQSRMSCH